MTREEALKAWEQMYSEIDKDNWLFVGTINPQMVEWAIKALAERKTENNSEKPNNCEDEFFREPTAEERKAVADYIDSISVPTGVNVFDLMDEPQTERSE